MRFCFLIISALLQFYLFLSLGTDVFTVIFCIPFFMYVALKWTEYVFLLFENTAVGQMAASDQKPTACVIYTVIDEIDGAISAARKIYDDGNREKLCFVFLCDCKRSYFHWSSSDDKKCSTAVEKVKLLNKYTGIPVYLFVQKRSYRTDNCSFDASGMDAGIFNLVHYIRRDPIGFAFVYADSGYIHRVGYLVTVDGKCGVKEDGINEMSRLLSSQWYKPLIDKGRVTEGYGVLSDTRRYNGYGAVNVDAYYKLVNNCDFGAVSDKLRVLRSGKRYIIRRGYDICISQLRSDFKELKNILSLG